MKQWYTLYVSLYSYKVTPQADHIGKSWTYLVSVLKKINMF